MDKPTIALAWILAASPCALNAQLLQNGEARLPLKQLQQLLDSAQHRPEPPQPPPPPAVLSSKFVISKTDSLTRVLATFRVSNFGNGFESIPLFNGDLSVLESTPADTLLSCTDDRIDLTTNRKGILDLTLQMTPSMRETHTLQAADSASRLIECGALPPNQAIELNDGKITRLIHPGDRVALPPGKPTITWRICETQAPLPPPKPSTWTWHHQVLAIPENQALSYHCSSMASTRDGDGIHAQLVLPRGCYAVDADGPDLVRHTLRMNPQGLPVLDLDWETRGVIQRRVEIRYQLPSSPLDSEWVLQSPDGETSGLLIADHPQLQYEHAGLRPVVPSGGLPEEWVRALKGRTLHPVASPCPATIGITRKPVEETSAGMIAQADWTIGIEPEGAMIATGTMVVSHKSPYDVIWEIPKGMQLLSCELNHADVPPNRLNDGRLSIHLTGNSEEAKLKLVFTERSAALDPLEGTLALALPTTPSFIARLDWKIQLPDGYQAESAGNLSRIPTKSTPSLLHLRKNLCRNETPQVQLFYQHSQEAQ